MGPEVRPVSFLARLPLYYGWVMVILAAAAMTGTMPGRTNFLGVISPALTADDRLNLSDGLFAQLNFWAVILGSVLCLPVGKLIDRVGVRVMLPFVAGGLGAAAIGMANVSDSRTLGIMLVLVRGLGQGALSVVALAMVGKWFTRRIGVAMGVFTVLLTFGFIAGAVWLEAAVHAQGWRTPWEQIGYGLLGLALLGVLFARNDPASIGGPHDGPATVEAAGPEFRVGDALRTRAFWVFTISGAAFLFLWSAITLFPKQLLMSRGFEEDALSTLFQQFLATLTFAGLPANLLGGWLARRVPISRLLAVGMMTLGAALALFPYVICTISALGFAALLGISGGIVTVVFFTAYRATFGQKHLGIIQGVAQVVTVVASAVGPVVMVTVAEQGGSYESFFNVAAVLIVLLGIWAWGTRPPTLMAR